LSFIVEPNNIVARSNITKVVSISLLLVTVIAGLASYFWQMPFKVTTPQIHQTQMLDTRSQREAYLLVQAQHLSSSLLRPTDIRMSLLIDDSPSQPRHFMLLVNRAKADEHLAQSLHNIVWSGMALSTARGDSIDIHLQQFTASSPRPKYVLAVVLATLMLLAGFLLWRFWRGTVEATESDIYQDQLGAFKDLAKTDPARVAAVLSQWLNGDQF
jgi:hypothetical protein